MRKIANITMNKANCVQKLCFILRPITMTIKRNTIKMRSIAVAFENPPIYNSTPVLRFFHSFYYRMNIPDIGISHVQP